MNNILFKAKRLDNGETVYGWPCPVLRGSGFNMVDGEHDQHYEWVEMPSDAYEIIEFTDLYDSNGREIWEGDIFQVDDCYDSFGFMAGEKREVYFADGGFRLKPDNPDKVSGHWLDSDVRGVVVGNVYQSPELI